MDESEVLDIGPLTPPDTAEVKRESVRRSIALYLTSAVIGISALAVVTVAIWPDRITALKEILPLIFTGLFGVYGTAMGFYFGEKK